LFGVSPILDSNIAFSINESVDLSNGLICNCLASGIEITANCFNGVGVE